MAKKLVRGVGVNDADYAVCPTVNGRSVWCPFYQAWVGMLMRCYDTKFQARHSTYIGCTVCDDWLITSNFKKWMESQDWQGMELDKDLLVVGNKFYSPETCTFVDSLTNNFTTDSGASRGEWPLGVDFHKSTGKFRSQCRNHLTGQNEHLGIFTCPEEAHLAWKKRKHELACQLADLQTDERAASALKMRYL